MKTRSILTATFALLLTASTFAVSFTWDGGAVFGPEWSRDNNWSGNNAPPSDGTADLFFAGSSRLDATADAAWNIRSLTFNSGAGVFDVQGSTLTIGSGGVTSNSANFQQVNNNIVLSAAQTFNTTSTGSLGLFGSVNLNGHALTVDPSLSTPSQVITFLGAISGAGGITKNGIGTMRLDNFTPNTFTDGITVNAGTLELTATDGIGGGVISVPGRLEIVNGDVVVQSSSQIANSASVIVRSSGSFVIGGVSSRAIDTIGVLTVDGGLVSIRPDCVLTASGLVMTGGQISGAVQSEFSLLGGGAVTVGSSAIAEISVTAMGLGGGVNTFNITNGTAAIDMRITAVISNGSITKTGAGLLQLAGVAANTYTGLTTVAAGTLELNKFAGVSAVAGSLTIGNGAPGGIVKLLDSDQISAASVVTIATGTLDLNNFNQTLAQPWAGLGQRLL